MPPRSHRPLCGPIDQHIFQTTADCVEISFVKISFNHLQKFSLVYLTSQISARSGLIKTHLLRQTACTGGVLRCGGRKRVFGRRNEGRIPKYVSPADDFSVADGTADDRSRKIRGKKILRVNDLFFFSSLWSARKWQCTVYLKHACIVKCRKI